MWVDTTISPAVLPATEVVPTEVPNVTLKEVVLVVILDLPRPDPWLPSQCRSKAIEDTSSIMHVVIKDAVVTDMGTPTEDRWPRLETCAGGDVPGEPWAVSKVPTEISTVILVALADLLPHFTCSTE